MRIVIALGGNALSKRGDVLSCQGQRATIRQAAQSLAKVLEHGHQIIITHGNGPQVGYLAQQGTAFPLDVLGAETEGMIGYVLQQELDNAYKPAAKFATLLTQIEVAPDDPAFGSPSKFVGPIYTEKDATRLSVQRGWTIGKDGAHFRRTVASPRPRRILEIDVIKLLVDQNVVVICAGGGGIPVVQRHDGTTIGIEAVIDKDHASGLLARDLGADAFLMLTDVDGVFENWGGPDQTLIAKASVKDLLGMSFPAGSMGPKVQAACEFVTGTGGFAAIGALRDTTQLIAGTAGTRITASP